MNALTTLCGIIIRCDDGNTGHQRVFRRHAPDCQGTRFARADNKRTRTIARALRRHEGAPLLAHITEYKPHAAHEENQQKARYDKHPDGKPRADNPQERGASKGAKHRCPHDLNDLVNAGVFPEVVVQAKCSKHQHIDACQNAKNEVNLVVDEHFTLHVREDGSKPIRNIRSNDVEQQQKRCSFCDMHVQTRPRLHLQIEQFIVSDYLQRLPTEGLL